MAARNKQTILIIDDSQDDVLLTKRALARFCPEISAEVACNGEEGLALLHKEETLPSIVLLDLKMPGMGGIDVLREIRSDERLKDIPVIVVTHSALESDIDASLEAGANTVMHKAFDIEQFSRDMEHFLGFWLTKQPG